ILCLLVTASFVLFVVHDTSVASAHQQEVVNSGVPPGQPLPGEGAPAKEPSSTGSARKTIDEVAEAVTSPFSAITSGWDSEWLKRGVLLLLTFAVYGFGLGFLARLIRVRV
ncbi:MAG TPA: hypothetical protein VMB05_02825, partial [Solirubrobacteraceae bacterium]|nr:hypothetical protein [Solirubrobacteraceae bacterium]